LPFKVARASCLCYLTDARHRGQGQFEGVGAVAPVSEGGQRDVQLLDQGQPRHGKPHPPGFLQGDPHVLDEVLDKEPGLEAVLDDPRGEVRKRPACRRPRADRLQHAVQVQPGAIAVEQGLADADHGAGDDHLVDQLGVLPGPGTALVDDRLTHRLETGHDRLGGLAVAADHDREPRLAGAHVAAGDRGIDRVDPSRGGRLGDLLRQRGLAGGHVHDDLARR
jgi:hypothetical protein